MPTIKQRAVYSSDLFVNIARSSVRGPEQSKATAAVDGKAMAKVRTQQRKKVGRKRRKRDACSAAINRHGKTTVGWKKGRMTVA